MKKIQEILGIAVTRIAREIEANIIVSIDSIPDIEYEDTDDFQVKIIIFKKIKEEVYRKTEYVIKIKNLEYGSITPVKEIIMDAITKGHINKGDTVICTQDSKLGFGYKGVIFIFEIDDTFFQISRHKLSEKIGSEVIEATLNISKEIAQEGREGKRVGTAFIIGNISELSKYMKQLIINPFQNLEEKPKVTDPKMRESIKEFAQLDGVFILDEEGHIISAGTYINIDHSDINLPEGFGTKHRSAIALTSKTDSLAIVISESGGKIRVIKAGKIILKI